MFNIIGAMAEFEQALIQERVKAGIRNARAKGKQLGRPRKQVDSASVLRLYSQGYSMRQIASELGLSLGIAHASVKHNHKSTSPIGIQVQLPPPPRGIGKSFSVGQEKCPTIESGFQCVNQIPNGIRFSDQPTRTHLVSRCGHIG